MQPRELQNRRQDVHRAVVVHDHAALGEQLDGVREQHVLDCVDVLLELVDVPVLLHGKRLHLLRALPDRVAEAREKTVVIDGLTLPAVMLPGKRVKEPKPNAPLYAPWTPAETEDAEITLVPYFAWNNRGKGEMRVWLAAE